MPNKYRWEKAARRAKSPRGPIERGLEPPYEVHRGCPAKGKWVVSAEMVPRSPNPITGETRGHTLERVCDGCGAVEILGDSRWERKKRPY